MSKFKVGDVVKVINYGHLIYSKAKLSLKIYSAADDSYDIAPELIGQIGVITKVNLTQGIDSYGIEGIEGKCAWYHNSQLRKLNLIEWIRYKIKEIYGSRCKKII